MVTSAGEDMEKSEPHPQLVGIYDGVKVLAIP
jgi:hypothetical protein